MTGTTLLQPEAQSSLRASLAAAHEAVAAAQERLAELTAAVQQTEEELHSALVDAARGSALADYDPILLQAFFQHPYVLRPLGQGHYELIVPRFFGLRAGWPVRETESYSIYEVSRFTHLLDPLPAWLIDELGFGEPAFRAILDGLTLTITEGDPADVARQLGGRRTISRRDGNQLVLRPASRFEVIRRIIRDQGFLPFAPEPIPARFFRTPEIATEDGQPAFTLRPYQQAAYEEFKRRGAISIFARPQTGKTYLALQALAELDGPKLILCPRRLLCTQWQARIELLLTERAAREVVVTTYQSAHKHFDQPWLAVIFDEAHHLPADFAVDAATNLRAVTRMALSATPFREDGNEDLIPALGGFPVGFDWPVAPAQLPTVTIRIVKDEAAKLQWTLERCSQAIAGKTLIFTQRLALGERIAQKLGAPFIYSETRDPQRIITTHRTIVVSSVADEGLSIPDIQRIVELDFLFGSRFQAGQRVGRLAHQAEDAARGGEYHLLMTAEEFHRYGKRLLVYERWGLSVTVEVDAGLAVQRPRLPARRKRSS